MKKIAVTAALSAALVLVPTAAQAGGQRHIMTCKTKPGSEVVVIYKFPLPGTCPGAVSRQIPRR